MYDVGCWLILAKGDVTGVCGRLKMRARGELGADCGVAGRGGWRRVDSE